MIFKFTWPQRPDQGDVYVETATIDFGLDPHGDPGMLQVECPADRTVAYKLPRQGLEVYMLDGTTGKTIDRPRLPTSTGVGCPNE